jgi:hypothetical protein
MNEHGPALADAKRVVVPLDWAWAYITHERNARIIVRD